MIDKEIEEGNILIAEFMGREFFAYMGSLSYTQGFKTHKQCLEFIKKLPKGYKPELGWKLGTGKYSHDWNWIMPVVIKICSNEPGLISRIYLEDNEYQFAFIRDNHFIAKGISKDPLLATFKAVVDYLKLIM